MDSDSPHEPVRLTPDDPLAGLATWLADGRVDAAAAERARQRWLERQAAEDATLVGVLLDLAERGRPVVARTSGGRNATGRVAALGADFVVVREERLGDVLVPTRALAMVRPSRGDRSPVGDRPAALAIVMEEALVELAADRPEVLVSAGGEEIRGDLRSAGRDVLAVELDTGERREIVSVATHAIDHLVIIRR
ncbi:MAG: hypothetical protein AAF548_17340 [Actinomycetota bacterium]